MAEWLKAHDSKSCKQQCFGGSNPLASAREYNMTTIFEKIINGEIPCYKIYEDEKTFAFLDINPETTGHTLVVPKKAVDKLYELSDEDYEAVFRTVKKVMKRVEEVFGARALLKVVGTDVPHAHVHITHLDDNWEHGKFLKLTDAEMQEICDKLKF